MCQYKQLTSEDVRVSTQEVHRHRLLNLLEEDLRLREGAKGPRHVKSCNRHGKQQKRESDQSCLGLVQGLMLEGYIRRCQGRETTRNMLTFRYWKLEQRRTILSKNKRDIPLKANSTE